MASAADRTAAPETAPHRSRARIWLRRLLVVFAIFALLLAALVAIGYFNRAQLLTLVLERAAAPNRLEAGATRFLGLKGIAFDDVAVFAPGSDDAFATAKTVTTAFNIDGLQRLHIDSIALEGISLNIPIKMLDRDTELPPAETAARSSRVLSLGALYLPDAKIAAALPDGTTISTTATYTGLDIRLSGGELQAKNQLLSLANTAITLPDTTTISFPEANTTIDFSPLPKLRDTSVIGTVTFPHSPTPLEFSVLADTVLPTKESASGSLSLTGSPIADLTLEDLATDFTWSPEGIALDKITLAGGSYRYTHEPSPQGETPVPTPNHPPIKIVSGSLGIDLILNSLPQIGDVTTSARIDLSDVTITDTKPASPSPQSLALTDTHIRLADDLGTATLASADASLTLTPKAELPASLTALTLENGRFALAPSPLAGRPALNGSFNADTTDGSTTLTIANLAAKTAKPDAKPFAYITKIDATLDTSTALDTGRIESVVVTGAHTTISNEIVDYLAPPTVPEPPAAETAPAKQWTLGSFSITNSDAILSEILPGLPPLPFAIDTELHDIPLSREGLLTSESPQTLTLSQVILASKLNPHISVVELGDLNVEFTLGGLIRQEIASVQVNRPTLFIGEHLFWYIDYFQSQPTETNTTTNTNTNTTPGGWSIGSIEAINGSLVLAPKGLPSPGLKPLPFSGKTSLKNGQLVFDLDDGQDTSQGEEKVVSIAIPKGNYPLNAFNLDLEIDLIGLEGRVAFNLPIGENTTNLVEVLEADKIVFEQLELTKAFVVITYDQNGVYAEFGGYAYGSYTQGEINLYLDQDWSWDGWLTSTGVEFDPLTEALTPTAVRMTGAANAEIIAQGDLTTLDHLTMTAKLNSTKPGKVDILALAELVENLAPETPELTRQLATVGLDVLQQFDYKTAKIDISTSGYEGTALFELAGPSGLRHIEVESHDVRFRPPTVTTTP